ncbi:MAG: glycosyltransferase family 2 protein [Deltaproteobacteria bacterium]|nr:glycosyltransferase family 2 protein [Deltaproteobacteria bacterium]
MESPPHIQPDITVCTAIKWQPPAARSLLCSLAETADPVAIEIFLVNRGGDSDSALLSEFPALNIFALPGETEVGACNQAAALAAGRYIMVVSHDVQIQPQCLLRLVEFMDDNPYAGLAAPRIIDAYGKPERTVRAFHSLFSLVRQFLPRTSGYSGRHDKHLAPFFAYKADAEVDWLWSGAKIIRRELIEDIGLPDAAMPPYFADMEYALRAKKAGWHNFYIHAATVLHTNPLRYDPRLAGRPFSLPAAVKFMKKKWLR